MYNVCIACVCVCVLEMMSKTRGDGGHFLGEALYGENNISLQKILIKKIENKNQLQLLLSHSWLLFRVCAHVNLCTAYDLCACEDKIAKEKIILAFYKHLKKLQFFHPHQFS